MANIRTRLIHMLGGVTKEELREYLSREISDAHRDGKWLALFYTMKCMEDNYGNTEWGHVVYNHVKNSLEELF